MLRFYYRLARKVPALIRGSTSTVQGITAVLIAGAAAAGPWLVQHGQGDLATYAAKVPGWWSVVPIAALVLFGLLRANYVLHDGVERERDDLRTRLADRRQRQEDAEELGKLRKTMRKRYYEWLEGGLAPPGAKDRAIELQRRVAKILDERYGYDVVDRFLTADDADSVGPLGLLLETSEYAGRIKRLRGIITRIRSGRIRRRVRHGAPLVAHRIGCTPTRGDRADRVGPTVHVKHGRGVPPTRRSEGDSARGDCSRTSVGGQGRPGAAAQWPRTTGGRCGDPCRVVGGTGLCAIAYWRSSW
jgi:hypothetical protein